MPQDMNYPGVYREEIDNSEVTIIDNSTTVATIGRAKKGIANSLVLVKSETELISKFGTPIVSGSYPLIKDVDYGIYSAIECLKETSNVWYVRLTNGTEKYAGVALSGTSYTTSGVISKPITATPSSAFPDDDVYVYGNTPSNIKELQGTELQGSETIRINAIGPGDYGNNVAISITTSAISGTNLSGSYDWGNIYGDQAKSGRVFKLEVFTKEPQDSFSTLTSASIPTESFYVSNDLTDVDNDGNSLYVSDVINGVSKYIYVKSSANGTLPTSTTSGTGSNVVKYFVPLVGGDNGNASLEYNADGVWRFFDNKELTPVNIAVMVPRPAPNAFNTSSTRTSEVSNLSSVISKRMDLLATVQVGGYDEIKKTVLVTKNITQFGGNDSYFAKYVGWNLVYDRYNASRVYLPNCIYAAAIMARTDRLTKPWEAPAGQDRGVIPAGKQNMFIKPEDGADLYKNYNLNTIKFINGLGSVIWGQKTAQLKNTARDRINVRRGLIYIENGSEKILNGFMFRGNTAKERERAASMVTAFMNTVKAGGGVTSFSVICDDTNNTQATIARNELYVDIILVPTYTIEFIKLRVTINATSVSVGEV